MTGPNVKGLLSIWKGCTLLEVRYCPPFSCIIHYLRVRILSEVDAPFPRLLIASTMTAYAVLGVRLEKAIEVSAMFR